MGCSVSYVFHVFRVFLCFVFCVLCCVLCVSCVLCIFALLSSLCPGLETQEVEGGQNLCGLGGALLQKQGAESHINTSRERIPESAVSGGPPTPLKGGLKHGVGLRGALYSVST